ITIAAAAPPQRSSPWGTYGTSSTACENAGVHTAAAATNAAAITSQRPGRVALRIAPALLDRDDQQDDQQDDDDRGRRDDERTVAAGELLADGARLRRRPAGAWRPAGACVAA